MAKPVIDKFSEIAELMVQSYERYLPTTFDESMTLLQKMNKIIEYLNQVGRLTTETVIKWNEVSEWLMTNGLNQSVNNKLDIMVNDGTIKELLDPDLVKAVDELTLEFSEYEIEWNTLRDLVTSVIDEDITNVLNNVIISTYIENKFNDKLIEYTPRLIAVEDGLVAHKEEYTSQRATDNLKVATVEKGLNDYKSTMANVNVNQEAKQKISGYGTISLPKNTANGQVSVSVKGNTRTNIAKIHTSVIIASNANVETVKLKKNTDYALSALMDNRNGVNSDIRIRMQNLSQATFLPSNYVTVGKREISSVVFNTGDYEDFRIELQRNGSIDDGISKSIIDILLEEGTVIRHFITGTKSTISASRLKSESTDKTQKSLMYLPNVGELRSVGIVKDEIIKADGVWKHIKRIDNDGVTILATPIITPIDVSGNLLSYPSGTVYIENVVADAGNYTTKFDIKELQLPIKSIDKLIKYNFTTGVQTVLDTSLAVINADKKSFTHPNLTNKDMVFVDYYYDVESTLGETTIEYYDSRHTIKDSVLPNKFYKWDIKSTNGVPTVVLTEVL